MKYLLGIILWILEMTCLIESYWEQWKYLSFKERALVILVSPVIYPALFIKQLWLQSRRIK